MKEKASDVSINAKPVLVIEDEPAMAQTIGDELKRLGYAVTLASSAAEGLKAARLDDAALIIVDRMLSGADSLAMIETLRSEGIRTPVLVVSGLSAVDERIRGLKAGGDDYLTKPFALGELTARVEALLRRTQDARATELRVGSLVIDLIARTVRRGGHEIELLPTEFKLLDYFMRRPGQVVTRSMLLEEVWGYRFLPQTNLVDVHVGKLRRKLDAEGQPPVIRSIRLTGFMLDVDH